MSRRCGVLAEEVDDIGPKTVDAPIEPEAQDTVHRLDHLRIRPVQVRLLRKEEMEIPGPRPLIPGPGRALAEGATPVVGKPVGAAVTPDVPVPLGIVAGGPRLEEPGVLV